MHPLLAQAHPRMIDHLTNTLCKGTLGTAAHIGSVGIQGRKGEAVDQAQYGIKLLILLCTSPCVCVLQVEEIGETSPSLRKEWPKLDQR